MFMSFHCGFQGNSQICFARMDSPSRPRRSSCQDSTITFWQTTLAITPLDEWSARCRDPYLTTHNIHKKQTSMPPAGFEPTIPASVTNNTRYYSSGREIGPLQRSLPDNTQHSQETDFHALCGVRTHNPSKRAAADRHLGPRGHWDRPFHKDVSSKKLLWRPSFSPTLVIVLRLSEKKWKKKRKENKWFNTKWGITKNKWTNNKYVIDSFGGGWRSLVVAENSETRVSRCAETLELLRHQQLCGWATLQWSYFDH